MTKSVVEALEKIVTYDHSEDCIFWNEPEPGDERDEDERCDCSISMADKALTQARKDKAFMDAFRELQYAYATGKNELTSREKMNQAWQAAEQSRGKL